jgi:hypothetical protein
MKKNLVSVAVAATVAGASAQASMYLNPDNTGSVLLFPYYNAQNGNETSMHIVNTTGDAKAVKVRFMEYVNSQEVLDFNLYLSPKDHFSFTIFKNPEGDGGAIITRDNSCTVPQLGDKDAGVPGSTTENADGSITRIQPFLNYQYAKDKDATYSRGLVGHVEVIEMGTVVNSATNTKALYKTWLTHGTDGVPADCGALVKAWSTGGTWVANDEDGITATSGGLYGLSNVLNAADAAAFGVEPAAIEAFWADGAGDHAIPGDTLPTLDSGDTSAIVSNNGESFDLVFDEGVDAVSSLFMAQDIYNDVMINEGIGGLTDWVVTFPTKRFYVNGTTAKSPFTDLYVGKTGNDTACEPIVISQVDREESITVTFDKPIFSPRPPETQEKGDVICYETNTLHAGAASALNADAVLVPFSEGDEGWMGIAFEDDDHSLIAASSTWLSSNGTARTGGRDLKGLPVMGFAAFKYVNGDRSYGFVSDHKTNTVGSAVTS